VTPRATPDSPIRWGEPPRGGRLGAAFSALVARTRATLGGKPIPSRESLPALPVALRRGELAQHYLAAEGDADHPSAGSAASTATEQAITERAWWPADVWGHRALWHFEQAGMELEATRAARRIGDVRVGGGDPASSRRYYAEAISEARDIGAEREEGLAALGMGRAELELRNVTTARRLGQIALDLLERAKAPPTEMAAARELRGEEKEVGG
jgi:hypothetical protein